MSKLKIILFLLFLLSLFLFYDGFIGKKSTPAFHTAPQFFCSMGWRGITLPPAGIFMCKDSQKDEQVKTHELIHWNQYRRMGTPGFYVNYVWGWVSSGFNYRNNPMEKEAYENKGTAL